jgi:ABC-type sugar transport system ATPase subunit
MKPNACFEMIETLKTKGVSVIYISHRLEEIRRVANRVTVLRDGEKIITTDLAQITMQEISNRWSAAKCQPNIRKKRFGRRRTAARREYV